MTQVVIDGKKVKLDNRDVIGMGGEATIFKYNGQALKLYRTPDAVRDKKIRAMLPKTKSLPNTVIAPQNLVLDSRSKQALGFTMRLLDTGYVEVRQLASKKHRAMTGLTTRDVARLFIHAAQTLADIHHAGMVVGDLNDLNVMYRGDEMVYIDVDSFQFDNHPCMVGTEAFLDPLLYNLNLAAQPHFTTDNDWYSFAVLLFKSLLLTHPYGGVHPVVGLLPYRAMQRISVLHPEVLYPRIAYTPDILSDDLGQVFDHWFSQGKRGAFPLAILIDYVHTLMECPSCHELYPSHRKRCPHCSAVIPTAAATNVRTLFTTPGSFVAWHITPSGGRFIAHEQGKAMLYVLEGDTITKKMKLFDAMPHADYAFVGDLLVVSTEPDSPELLIVDTSGEKIVPLLKTTTGRFGNGERVFGGGGDAVYRLANGYLMRGQFRYGQLLEQAVTAISEDQTWLRVSPDGDNVFGFFRVLDNYTYWLLHKQKRVDLKLPPLAADEFVIETAVRFTDYGITVLRLTQQQGVEQVRVDEVDFSGKAYHAFITKDVALYTPLDAPAAGKHALLLATDKGIVREMVNTRVKTTFLQTERVIQQGNRLFPYQQGLLMLNTSRALYVTV